MLTENLNSIEMENSKKMMDLVYFGYAYETDSKKLENEFMEEIKVKFPECDLKDAYDEIKGYRREVILPDEKKDDYYSWVFAFGWAECSLSANLMMMGDDANSARKYIAMAKSQYPENFKSADSSM